MRAVGTKRAELAEKSGDYSESTLRSHAGGQEWPAGAPRRDTGTESAGLFLDRFGGASLAGALHFYLAAQNGAPVLVLRHGHSALHTDPHARFRGVVPAEQTLNQ